jgi:hypothetical protein
MQGIHLLQLKVVQRQQRPGCCGFIGTGLVAQLHLQVWFTTALQIWVRESQAVLFIADAHRYCSEATCVLAKQ